MLTYFKTMKDILFILIAVMAGVLSIDSYAQSSQIKGVKNQLDRAKQAASAKVPKVPQVSIPCVIDTKNNSHVLREFKPKVLSYKIPKSILAANKYNSAFSSLLKNSKATGDDYLLLYYTMGCDSKYDPILNNLKLDSVADKYLSVDNPTPERLAEVLATARQQFPKQPDIQFLRTPSGLLIDRATPRYYQQVLNADSTFTDMDAAILSQIYDEYLPMATNEGSILYYYLTGLYEYAIPSLEHYFKTFEKYPASDNFIKRHINEIVPKFQMLERSYNAIGFTERRDSLVANPIYQRVIK